MTLEEFSERTYTVTATAAFGFDSDVLAAGPDYLVHSVVLHADQTVAGASALGLKIGGEDYLKAAGGTPGTFTIGGPYIVSAGDAVAVVALGAGTASRYTVTYSEGVFK